MSGACLAVSLAVNLAWVATGASRGPEARRPRPPAVVMLTPMERRVSNLPLTRVPVPSAAAACTNGDCR